MHHLCLAFLAASLHYWASGKEDTFTSLESPSALRSFPRGYIVFIDLPCARLVPWSEAKT